MLGRLLAVLLTLFVANSRAPAAADDGAPEGGTSPSPPTPHSASPPPEYDEAVALAIKEFELGNYLEARTRLLQAHRVLPSARTNRGLGMVAYELSDYVGAIRFLEQALSSATRPLEGSTRLETEQLLVRAQAYVGRVEIVVSPHDATLRIDEAPSGAPSPRALLLPIGRHRIDFQAAGRRSEHRDVEITGGEQLALHVALAPLAEPRAVTAADVRESRLKALRRNPWLWSAVGAIAVGAAVGLGFALRSSASAGEPEHRGGTSGVSLPGPMQ